MKTKAKIAIFLLFSGCFIVSCGGVEDQAEALSFSKDADLTENSDRETTSPSSAEETSRPANSAPNTSSPTLSSVFTGTWCYVSGYQEPASVPNPPYAPSAGGTITSFVFKDFDSSLYSNISNHYHVTPIDGMFGRISRIIQQDAHTLINLRYYNPNSNGSWANKLEFSGDNLKVTYGNAFDDLVGVASFVRVGGETAACSESIP